MKNNNVMSFETHDKLCQEYFDEIDERITDNEGMDSIIQPPTESELRCMQCVQLTCGLCSNFKQGDV